MWFHSCQVTCIRPDSSVYRCGQEPARALLQRRTSSIASPRAGLQGILKSPRQSMDGVQEDRRAGGMPGNPRGAPMAQDSPTMTDATGLVCFLQRPCTGTE